MNIENTKEGSMQCELVPLKQRHRTGLKLPGLIGPARSPPLFHTSGVLTKLGTLFFNFSSLHIANAYVSHFTTMHARTFV